MAGGKKHIPSALSKLRKKESFQGFTLLELLISLVIIVIILTLTFESARLGLNVWEKSGENSDQERRVQVIKNLIKSQIASICTREIINSGLDTDNGRFMLTGSENSIEFITDYSLSPDTVTKPVYVKYYIDNNNSDGTYDLFLLEKEICTLDYDELNDLQQFNTVDDRHILLEKIRDLKIEFLKKNMDGTGDWHDSWNNKMKQPADFPAAVRINFVFEKKTVSLMVKIMSDYRTAGNADK